MRALKFWPRSSRNFAVPDLRSHLDEVLRQVRRGVTVMVYDRQKPIARVVPYEVEGAGLVVRRARGNPHTVRLPPAVGAIDSLSALNAEREDRT